MGGTGRVGGQSRTGKGVGVTSRTQHWPSEHGAQGSPWHREVVKQEFCFADTLAEVTLRIHPGTDWEQLKPHERSDCPESG